MQTILAFPNENNANLNNVQQLTELKQIYTFCSIYLSSQFVWSFLQVNIQDQFFASLLGFLMWPIEESDHVLLFQIGL